MSWEITEEGKTLKVAVEGRLVAAVAPSLREEVMGKITEGVNVLFDLSQMVHIDSSGLGVLVQVLQTFGTWLARKADKRLKNK